MNLFPRTLSAALIAAIAGAAIAAPPAALDRVPANAAAAFTIRNVEEFTNKIQKRMDALPVPGDVDGLGKLADPNILATPGLDKKGSMAIFVVPAADGSIAFNEEGGPIIILAPVTDAGQFITALGGNKEDKIAALTVEGRQGFARAVDGYVAMSQYRDLLEGFDGKPGNAETHLTAAGPAARRTADSADVLLVANIVKLQAQLNEAAANARQQADMMGGMADAQVEGAADVLGGAGDFMNSWVRDGNVAIAAVGVTESGTWFELTSSFKEGSELAKLFAKSSNTDGLIAALPSQPFFIAGGIDTTSPAMRAMMKDFSKPVPGEDAKADALLTRINSMSDKLSGMSFIIGATDGLLSGGVLNRTSYFLKSSEPAAFSALTKDAITKLNGTTEGPVKFATTYKSGASEIAGVKVDTWTIKPEVDPNDPEAGNIEQMQAMLYGEGDMGGMMAEVPGGVVVSASQNTPLMTSAINAAKGGPGLGNDALVKEVRSVFPAGRSAEFYLGSKSIIDAISEAISGFTGAEPVKTPDKLAPIAIALGSEAGSASLRVFIPSDAQAAIDALMKSMEPAEMEPAAAPADDKQRF